MVHLNGRVLDAFIGRMLSPDPYIQDAGSTQDFNRYAYTRNNPLTYIDPTGYDLICYTTHSDGSTGFGEVILNPATQICVPFWNFPWPTYHPSVTPGGGEGEEEEEELLLPRLRSNKYPANPV